MRVIDLALKDLMQILKDGKALILLVAMPVVFTLFMSFAYRAATSQVDARLALGWVNQDGQGALGAQLGERLAQSDAIRLVEADEARADEQVATGKLATALIVPPDWSARAEQGQPVQLVLVADAMSTTGQSILQIVRGQVTRLMSAAEIARMGVEWAESSKALSGAEARHSEWNASFAQAMAEWQQSDSAGLRVTLRKAEGKPQGQRPFGGNPYNQSSPGMLVQFAIFGLTASAQVLTAERKTRSLQRLLTTAMRPWEVLAGHYLAMFVLVFAQEALLVVFGQLILGVSYLREPLGTLLVMTGLGLWVASMGLLIGVVASSDDQVVLFSLIAMFLFTSLAGAWFPLEGSGPAYAAIGRVTPGAWAMTGFQNILLRGLGLGSALLPGAILLAYAAGFFALAVWRFRPQ